MSIWLMSYWSNLICFEGCFRLWYERNWLMYMLLLLLICWNIYVYICTIIYGVSLSPLLMLLSRVVQVGECVISIRHKCWCPSCCCWLHGENAPLFYRIVVCRYTPLSLILICIGGGSCPGMFIHSTGEGSCPGMLVIHFGEGLCPGML